MKGETTGLDLYGGNYGRFDVPLYAEIRREAFGEDLGSNSWLTGQELEGMAGWLALDGKSNLLDVGCGPGGPVLRLAQASGCRAVGVDRELDAIAHARAAAARIGLDRLRFEVADAAGPLPFASESFDAVLCVDAINHFPDRALVLTEWRRLLRPGGRLVFTDPVVLTGPISADEIRQRSAIGFYLFLPDGRNEEMLDRAGFDLSAKEDATANVELIAGKRWEARQSRAGLLVPIEGQAFEAQQRFLQICSQLAGERRLSRFLYLAVRA